MQIRIGAQPLGSGRVRLSWDISPAPSIDMYVNGADVGGVLTASVVAILENQPLGKHTYQLVDKASGTKSNVLTVNVT
jgi:hypothetical protein